MEGAVADIAAAGTGPCRISSHLVDIFAIAHVQAISAEVPEQALAFGAGRALTKSLLAALVAGDTIHLVVYLQSMKRGISLRQFTGEDTSWKRARGMGQNTWRKWCSCSLREIVDAVGA